MHETGGACRLKELKLGPFAGSIEVIGTFDMDCGCMKRPARVAACSRGGVENGSVKLDIPASRGLLR